MIFVTVGSRSFPFDRLLKGIDQAISEGTITDEVFAQSGSGSYQPRFFQWVPFMDHDQFEEKMKEADLIIAHGGTGVIMNALKMGKRVVAVPRLADYREAVDDNQTQLIRELEKAGLVTACYDCTRIGAAVDLAGEKEVLPYQSNSAAIISSIDNYLDQVWRKKEERCPRILMVSNMYPGKDCPGAGTFVRNLYDQMKACGADVHLSVMKWRKGRWWKLWAYPLFYLITFLKLITFSYDLVLVQYASHSSPPVLWARRFRPFRIDTNVHGSDVLPSTKSQKRFRKYTKRILSVSERIIVPSLYFRQVVRKKYGIPADKIMIYPSGGVDPMIFHPLQAEQRTAIRKKYHLDESKITFVYAGRLVRGKGYDVFLRAIRRLENRGCAGNYLMIGEGDCSRDYDRLADELGLKEQIVRFPLVAQETLAEIYGAADVFVFPTMRKGESLGLVAIEAMACGLPVIGSDYAAARYYICDGVNGYRFPVGDDQALADQMAEFTEGNRPLETLSRGALDTAKGYSREICETMIRDMLGQIPMNG